MPISPRGQLDLSTPEQINGFQDCVIFSTAGADDALITDDPDDADRSAVRLRVTSTSDLDSSRLTYQFEEDQEEVWIELDIQYDHPASSSNEVLVLLALATANGTTKVELTRVTDSTTRWRPVVALGSLTTYDFSTGVAKSAWERIRLRYKRNTGGGSPNGIVQAWRFNFGTGNYVQQLNVTNHTATDLVRQIVLLCAPSDTVASTSGNKVTWFRAFTWGTAESHVGFKHRGLQFGHVCSGSSSSTIDAALWYRFPRDYHGRAIEPFVRFQYKASSSGTWITSGSDVELEADGQGEMIANHAVQGLEPLTSYDFRAQILEDSAVLFTTEVITCTTPSAAAGDPGQLKYAFGSCCQSGPMSPSPHPHTVMSMIQAEEVNGFIHLGDMIYAEYEIGYDDDELTIRSAYRKNFLWHYEDRQLLESAAFFPMWDDHDSGTDNFNPPSNPVAYAASNPAALAYWVNRRFNQIAGGHGWWFDTAKCRFIMMDMRSGKNPVTPTMLGLTQHAAVKALLEDTGKSINILFSPGPVVQGHGLGGNNADGWNHSGSFLSQRDDLFSHFFNNNDDPENSILIICSGDRHFAYVATDWGASYDGRVKPEWCSSPLAFNKRNPASLHKLGVDNPPASTVDYYELGVHGSIGGSIKRYCLIEIDETNLTVDMTLVNAETQQIMYGPITYDAS